MKLFFIPKHEFDRLLNTKDAYERAALFSDAARLNVLYMIMRAGSGHIGTSFSAIDIMTWLWLSEMKSPNKINEKDGDIYFSSKGHDAPAYYSILIGLGMLDFEYVHKLRRLGGLPGHPDVNTPHMITNTGSLGMGVSKARGMAFSKRLSDGSGKYFVLTGDGELQEGHLWESLQPTVNGKFGEITMIVDHNKIQSDLHIDKTSDLGNLEEKFKSFGWEVERCDGHDFKAIEKNLKKFREIKHTPQILIADTIKGKGVSFMENVASDGFYKYHSGAPSYDDYSKAVSEIQGRMNAKLAIKGMNKIDLIEINVPDRVAPKNPEELIKAYGESLVELALRHKNIIAMDADLLLDTGLIPFKNKFPERYIEAGIAEQDMVSMAGGLALSGKLPIVHSFACFLSTRPNEQIYNNATEKTKIIYVGSLAGLIPAGPGHSHQSVRDISALGSVPGLTLIEPSSEMETKMALRWAVEENTESTYIRLVSVPVEVPYRLPDGYILKKGCGVKIKEGKKAAIIAYGPVMLKEAFKAAEEIGDVAVYNLPWLNYMDYEWIKRELDIYKDIFYVDDHYLKFAPGEMFAEAVQSVFQSGPKVTRLGLSQIPESGSKDEVLAHHKLDSGSIIRIIKEKIK